MDSVPQTQRRFCAKSKTRTQPLLVPSATSPLTAMTVGCPSALCAMSSAAADELDGGRTRAERRLSGDHLMVRTRGEPRLGSPTTLVLLAAPPPPTTDDVSEAGVPVPTGRSDAEGSSKRFEVDERRETLSSAEVEGDPPATPKGGRAGYSSAVL